MHHLEIAVPTPLDQTFTYISENAIARGTRVLVPFGARKVVGVVIGSVDPGEATPADKTTLEKTQSAATKKFKLRAIEQVIDEQPVFTPTMMELAQWISRYYWAPIGEVYRAMLPASNQKQNKHFYILTEKGQQQTIVADAAEGALLKAVFSRKSQLSQLSLQSKLSKLYEMNPPWQQFTLESLLKKKLIEHASEKKLTARSFKDGGFIDELLDPANIGKVMENAEQLENGEKHTVNRPNLTSAQQEVVAFVTKMGNEGGAAIKPVLLHGVTGAGKTEVFLHLIDELCLNSSDGQALVLVPEISLTPQMTRVFNDRFPGMIAVVHSQMTDNQRWQQLQQIYHGHCRILIGPRSAVFAPFRHLKLLIVDEEHDGSYKQSSGVTYHGRDVAIVRAKLEQAKIVLASATPAMESYQNAMAGKYHLQELPERISKRPLPEIQCLSSIAHQRSLERVGKDLDSAATNEIPVHPDILEALATEIKAGRQAIVLVNRRGYASYLFALNAKEAVRCPNCSISLTLHHKSKILNCHYCDFQVTSRQWIEQNPDETFIAIGYGSQKAEDFLQQKLPQAKIMRVDSDLTSKRSYLPEILTSFRNGEIDILVGTQILAKGHDFPNVTLIVILEIDKLLDLPDFRAGERTFQLIVQAAGRAGRGELPGRVLMQTMRTAHYVVADAIRQDFKSFAEKELKFRRSFHYPPFYRQTVIELTGPDAHKLKLVADRIHAWKQQWQGVAPAALQEVQIFGPAEPPLEMIRRQFRQVILFSCRDLEPMRQVLAMFFRYFRTLEGLTTSLRLKVDVDPQDLL